MARDIESLLRRAEMQLQHHHLHGAVESLRQALTLDPDYAQAHALLAICLHDQRRLHAADYEVGAALALDAQSPFVHYAAAVVRTAQRRFDEAQEHFQSALALDPSSSACLRGLARLYGLWNRQRDVLPLLERAREEDPDDPSNWAALAEHHRDMRQFDRAEEYVRRALEIDPENADALLTMGYLLLGRGDTESAREHALLVLRGDANNEGAIALLTAVKARRNPLLGVWWSFNSFFGAGSLTRRVVLLIGFYLAYRVAAITLKDLGHEQAGLLLTLLWLAFCVYTWIGPAIFQRLLRRELEPARLDSGY